MLTWGPTVHRGTKYVIFMGVKFDLNEYINIVPKFMDLGAK